MRGLPILVSLVWLAFPLQAVARPRPTIAVAPLDGDSRNKIALAVVDALAGKDFVVIGPEEVSREQDKLGLSDELAPKDARKLAAKLGAVALVEGKVTKAGKQRSLHLKVHRRGKPTSGFTVELTSTSSDGFRRDVHDEIARRLAGAGDDGPADDEDDQARKRATDDDRKRKLSDGDPEHRPRKHVAEDDEPAGHKRTGDEPATVRRKRGADDDEPTTVRRKRGADDDEPTTARRRRGADDDEPATARRKRVADDDEPTTARRKRVAEDDEPATARRKRVAADDEPVVRKRKGRKQLAGEAAPQALARVSAGGLVAQRRLTYDTRTGLTPNQAPPRVLTTAGAGQVDGELYPFALANPSSGLAGFGLAGTYDKTFGLSIKIPNQPLAAPINQAHYAVGARYRFDVGEASNVVLGLDYVRRHYIADRSSLMAVILDMPDVDYTAVAPGIAAHVPVTPSATLFGGLDGMLILDTGAIQKAASYGSATVYGIDVLGGVDLALARQIGLRVALAYSQINFSFSGKGMMAMLRDNDATTQDVNGATDRSIGASVTLGLVY